MAKRVTGKKTSARSKATPKRTAAKKKKRSAAARSTKKKAASSAKRKAVQKSLAARRKSAARSTASRRATRSRTAAPSATQSAAASVRGAVAGAVAAVSKVLPWTSSEQDAVTLLETDHRRLEDLLKQGEETTERAIKGRTELLNTLTRELNAHELIEEKLFYPALGKHPEAKDIVLEGFQEHHVADLIVKELHAMARGNEQWGAKFKVLKENIEHHIKEEEGPMFRTARGVMGRDELLQLGQRMARMRDEALR